MKCLRSGLHIPINKIRDSKLTLSYNLTGLIYSPHFKNKKIINEKDNLHFSSYTIYIGEPNAVRWNVEQATQKCPEVVERDITLHGDRVGFVYYVSEL